MTNEEAKLTQNINNIKNKIIIPSDNTNASNKAIDKHGIENIYITGNYTIEEIEYNTKPIDIQKQRDEQLKCFVTLQQRTIIDKDLKKNLIDLFVGKNINKETLKKRTIICIGNESTAMHTSIASLWIQYYYGDLFNIVCFIDGHKDNITIDNETIIDIMYLQQKTIEKSTNIYYNTLSKYIINNVKLLQDIDMSQSQTSLSIELDRYKKMKQLLQEINKENDIDDTETTSISDELNKDIIEDSIAISEESVKYLNIDDNDDDNTLFENITDKNYINNIENSKKTKIPLDVLRSKKCISLYRCQCTDIPPRRILDMEDSLYYYIIPKSLLCDVVKKHGGANNTIILSFTEGLVNLEDVSSKMVCYLFIFFFFFLY